VVSASRDRRLLAALVQRVSAWALLSPFLLVTDGLAGYWTAFKRALRSLQRDGQSGRPALVPSAGVVIGKVVKQYQARQMVGVTRCLVEVSETEEAALLTETQGGGVLNTAEAGAGALWNCPRRDQHTTVRPLTLRPCERNNNRPFAPWDFR
jgi:hypothetical protein